MADLIVTIDGPAASGKSTVARLVAERLGASFLDTGAMYRAVTLAAMQAGVDMNDEKKLLKVLSDNEFKFAAGEKQMFVSINGINVTERLREPMVTANARYIASSPGLRTKLVQMQRQFAAGEQKIVTEGRDQGTVAFPNAGVKFFLTAAITTRAERRQTELRETGSNESLEQIQKAIEKRDKSDENRTVGPLKPAADAVVIDTTDLSIEQVVQRILDRIKKNV
jgi:cytidylate kinase